MRPLLRYFIKPLSIILCLCMVYTLLLTLAFIPSNSLLEAHVYQASVQITEQEGMFLSLFDRDKNYGGLDNCTDLLMLGKTVKPEGDSPFVAALSGYARYWHGYLLTLRPLLSFFSYGDIRYINMFVHMLLLCAAFYTLAIYRGRPMAFLYVFTWCFGYVSVMPLSLQFTSVTLITHLAVMGMTWLLHKGVLTKENLHYAFLVVGSLTTFFDLWTFPLVSLGLPLGVAYLALSEKNAFASASRGLRAILLYSAYWAAGYFMTYLMRWVLSDLFTDEKTFQTALASFLYRIGGGVREPGDAYQRDVGRTILKNIKHLLSGMRMTLLLPPLAPIAFFMVKNRKSHSLSQYIKHAPLLLPALYPLLWYAVFENHSYLHVWYTYRNLLASLFLGFSYLLLFTTGRRPASLEPSKAS